MKAAPGARHADGGAVMIVLTTVPDAVVAGQLARQLVAERLIACANILPAVTSVFRWQGETQQEAEVLMLMKTREPAVAPLMERLPRLHPYEVPEFVAIKAETVAAAYAEWVTAETLDC